MEPNVSVGIVESLLLFLDRRALLSSRLTRVRVAGLTVESGMDGHRVTVTMGVVAVRRSIVVGGITIGRDHHRWHSVRRMVIPGWHTPGHARAIRGVLAAWRALVVSVMELMLVSYSHLAAQMVAVFVMVPLSHSLAMVPAHVAPAHRLWGPVGSHALMMDGVFTFMTTILCGSLCELMLRPAGPIFADGVFSRPCCLQQDLSSAVG